ncbi:MAG: hypothetical protein ACPGJV_14170 [Bacteriovoracaceae bacterium]
MIIEILSWDKFNPRKDLRSMPWFRLESDIGYSETLFGLDAEAKWLWVFILSTCARKMKSSFEANFDYMSFHSGVSVEKVKRYLELFENKGLVQVTNESDRVTNESDRITNESDRNRTLHNEHNEHNEQDRTDRVRPETDKSKFLKALTCEWNKYFKKTKPAPLFFDSSLLREFEISLGFIPDLDDWKKLILKIYESDFARENPTFTLSWLICAQNARKVSEGKYADRVVRKSKGPNSVAIKAAISSGAQKISEIPKSIELTECDKDWIRDNGGLKTLGQFTSQPQLNQMLSNAS